MHAIVSSASESAFYDLWDRLHEIRHQVLEEFFTPLALQPWKLVSARLLKKVWSETTRLGFVRNERALTAIEDQFLENIMRLQVNTELAGHTFESPDDIDDRMTDPEVERFYDFIFDEHQGACRISDYGLNPLLDLAAKLFDPHPPEVKLVILDRILNVVHARSDLASWFVEGGSKTLTEISS